MRYPKVTCSKLTSKRYRCKFKGLTRRDVSEGNVDGHSGSAYVIRYSYGIDVRLFGYRWGGNA